MEDEEEKSSSWLERAIADNSLTIALSGLFVIFLAGQAYFGWRAFDDLLRAKGHAPINLAAYLGTGDFLDGLVVNWQAAILQLAVLIVFSTVLRQKGAAHSRKKNPPSPRRLKFRMNARPGVARWLAANSLSLAFIAMFLATFGLHVLFGQWKYNEQQDLMGLPRASLLWFVGSSSFWNSVLQCWEAEFAVIAIYVVASIFLRQEDSAESKPVEASDEQTGGANE